MVAGVGAGKDCGVACGSSGTGLEALGAILGSSGKLFRGSCGLLRVLRDNVGDPQRVSGISEALWEWFGGVLGQFWGRICFW